MLFLQWSLAGVLSGNCVFAFQYRCCFLHVFLLGFAKVLAGSVITDFWEVHFQEIDNISHLNFVILKKIDFQPNPDIISILLKNEVNMVGFYTFDDELKRLFFISSRTQWKLQYNSIDFCKHWHILFGFVSIYRER